MEEPKGPTSAYDSPTFGKDGSFFLDKPVGSASISPCGRDVVLASRQGLHIIDLDSPWSPPRHLPHHTPWEVADVQWSPFAARDFWVVSTSNQKALVWNLEKADSPSSVEHVLHAHTRAITDINFSAHHPDILATCAVDSFVHCWDLRYPERPAVTFCDWFAGATQVKWNRQDSHIVASSHDKLLRIWDNRKGAHPLRSIEAHATKIYGVDWDRIEATRIVTCSLDRTIKFWDYEKKADEPDRVVHTPFPVWRARHTPFGSGLLAMPQRGDYDLHLYDRRGEETEDDERTTSAVHKFGGHNDHVKEFLWRPRGSTTETIDDREFQLISWGTDKVLRLHPVDEDVLGSVGYEKGVKRNFNVTRKNAIYKTFREGPPGKGMENASTGALKDHERSEGAAKLGTRSGLTVGMSKTPVSFIGGYGNVSFMRPVVRLKSRARKEMDPIVWMRGVKIGKRETSPDMHQSVSSIVSPGLRNDPTWDVFESLAEEITHVGDKFRKVKFDTIDVQKRYVIASLSGPWGPLDDATYLKACIDFPPAYPDSAPPSISLETTASISDDTVTKIFSDIDLITTSFASWQRSSLEAILRYLLGEQSVEDSVLWLKKRQSVDLDSTQDLDLSSSDEDDEVLGRYTDPHHDSLEASDPMIAVQNAQYNVPLPKACGALWADNGLLVCFFPSKKEESSLLELSLQASHGFTRSRKTMFEGFGRLQNMSTRQAKHASTLETIESGDSEFAESSTSSSESSSPSDDIGLPQHHFMPSMAWRGDTHEVHPGVSLDESQKSSSDSRLRKSSRTNPATFVSIHDLADLLPAKQRLAERYIIGRAFIGSTQNAQVAKENGYLDLADVWSFVGLLLQNKVPLDMLRLPRDNGSIVIVARHAMSKLKAEDSEIDLSFDDMEEQRPASVKWGHHPLGQQWFVDSLFRYYEQLADVQMLAMLSCAFSVPQRPLGASGKYKQHSSRSSSGIPLNSAQEHWNSLDAYYPSEDVAKALTQSPSPNLSVNVDYQTFHSGLHSSTSSIGAPTSDPSTSGTPPSNYKPLRTGLERRDSQATSLSTSPEYLRHTPRSSSNLSALAASFSRPFSFGTSAASSPPSTYPKKRLSPAGSFLATQSSTIAWSPAFLGKSSTISEDPKSTLPLTVSDNDEEEINSVTKKPFFSTKLKNQDQFHNDSYANVPLLDLSKEWRYHAYREAYAHLLYIWGMPIAGAEILKYNHSSASSNPSKIYLSDKDRASILAMRNASIVDQSQHEEEYHLGFKDHCRSCSTILSFNSTTRRCQACSRTQIPIVCLLCNTFTRGLFSPCLNCGHVLHKSCRELLFSLVQDEVPNECISGCGCVCADYSTVAIGSPDKPAKSSYEASPAITIIGETGVTEQEQLGWRENSEWEDVAYESLARNLRSRQEVSSRSAQIWRPRQGSR